MAVAIDRETGEMAAEFERVYDELSGMAYGIASRHLNDGGRAADVVQDVFLNLWLHSRQFDPQRGSVRAWVAASTRNRSIDALRRGGTRQGLEMQLLESVHASGDPVEDEGIRNLESEQIRAALAALPQPQREVVDLVYLGGWTQQQAAAKLGVPLSTVKGRSRIALEKLRGLLSHLEAA